MTDASEQREWQRTTAIRKIEEDQAGNDRQPLRNSFAFAARYVGASIAEVERWWNARGTP